MHGCNQYVTVWNRWRDINNLQAPDIFYRHILPVMCKYKTKVVRGAEAAGVVVKSTQQAIIPFTEMHAAPSEWQEFDEDNRHYFFTLQEGDIAALGTILFDITGVSPWRETDVIKRLRPTVFTIGVIYDNTISRMGRHWKIEGT